MEQSEQINELATAMAKAQGEMKNAVKSADNPYFKSKYADLAGVIDACRMALSNNGISVIQPVGIVNEKLIEVTTQLMHSSGQWIRSTMTIPMVKLDPQACGSAITYARRYSLAAMVGLAQADDDANLAMAQEPPANTKPTKKAPANVKKAQETLGGEVTQVSDNDPYVQFEGDKVFLLGNNGWVDLSTMNESQMQSVVNNPKFARAHAAAKHLLKWD